MREYFEYLGVDAKMDKVGLLYYDPVRDRWLLQRNNRDFFCYKITLLVARGLNVNNMNRFEDTCV